MRLYHFEMGNSNEGPVGYCARVMAESPEEAVERLRAQLDAILDANSAHNLYGEDEHGEGWQNEYINVYFRVEAVTAAEIDGIEDPNHGPPADV